MISPSGIEKNEIDFIYVYKTDYEADHNLTEATANIKYKKPKKKKTK